MRADRKKRELAFVEELAKKDAHQKCVDYTLIENHTTISYIDCPCQFLFELHCNKCGLKTYQSQSN